MTQNSQRTLPQLLSDRRFSTGRETSSFHDEDRSPFDTDGDKVSFSEGFRALADKTQVHDRVLHGGNHRNRLTHSMEVSRVGRSLGVAVGARMIAYYGLHAKAGAFWRTDPLDIGHAVAVAGLAHDIGNPPFGHDGEDAISNFFRHTETGQKAVTAAGQTVGAELCQHEGNAQGFRMITRSMGWRNAGGLNLTAASLAAFGKYPFFLQPGARKYGVHHADREVMSFVAEASGMIPWENGWIRHPLAWLMEAADDICYLTVDLEDAAGLGLIPLNDLYDLYAPVIGSREVMEGRRISETPRRIQYLRSRMIKALIASCVDAYPELAEALDTGSVPQGPNGNGLIAQGHHGAQMQVIRTYSKENIYRSEKLQSSRAMFRRAMTGALKHLVGELLVYLDSGDRLLTTDADRFPALARLPHAHLGVHIPQSADLALPWLLDQVTLMSDAQVLAISEMS